MRSSGNGLGDLGLLFQEYDRSVEKIHYRCSVESGSYFSGRLAACGSFGVEIDGELAQSTDSK